MSENVGWWRLELQIRRHPITLFQLAVFALHYESWESIVLLIGAVLLDRHVLDLDRVDHWSSELWKVLRFVQKHSACHYERIDLATVVAEDVISRYRTQLMTEGKMRRENQLRSLFGLQPFNEWVRRRTRIYVVTKGSSREKPCPTTFMTDLGGFIFVTESPKNIVGLQRFFLLHELGHLSQFSTYTSRRARVGGSPFFFLYFWAFPQLIYPQFSAWSFLAWTIFGLAIKMFRDVFWFFVRKDGDGLNEMDADRFALQNLSRKELLTVARFYQHWPIPADPSLLPAIDAARRDLLRRNLKQAFATQGRDRKWWGHSQQVKTELPVWICFALAAVLVPFANPPSNVVMGVAAFICLGSMFLFWNYWIRAHFLERWIERVLAVDPSTAADVVPRWPQEPWWQKRLRVGLGYEAYAATAMSSKRPTWKRRLEKLFGFDREASSRGDSADSSNAKGQAKDD
ncbi:hypothetical protein AAFG07_33285 [Bradyrhizobium sp. B097]|uniref:hypothetical protein n=1 Tax=Bradyrhizobium sp. B097 TaxID=3140244 RepID=UPI0031834C74